MTEITIAPGGPRHAEGEDAIPLLRALLGGAAGSAAALILRKHAMIGQLHGQRQRIQTHHVQMG